MRPNILLFLTDDHGAWAMRNAGNSELHTPNLDRLAREGVRFENAFTPSPVCSPARACLLTGRTPSQVGIHDWLQEQTTEIGNRDWLADEITLPELLHQAGYHCGLSGKWHLGQSHLTPRGFDWCFGLPRTQGTHNGPHTYHLNGEELPLEGNKTAIITDYALQFLDETPADKPFFLNVGYISTHSPYRASHHADEVTALYQDATFADIPAYEPHPQRRNEGFPQEWTSEDLRERYIGYYAAVTEIDAAVGRILDALEEQGRLDETLVIYTADHGCAIGHHGFWGKGNSTRPLNAYEVSLRVPLLLRHPSSITAKTVVQHCVDHYDTFQTLCEIGGAQLDEARAYPGASYAPLLRGDADDWDDTIVGEQGDQRFIRTLDWKWVRRYHRGENQLFDLRNDAGETVNLAAQPEYADVTADLQARLDAFYARYDDLEKSGLRVAELPVHNQNEAWRGN